MKTQERRPQNMQSETEAYVVRNGTMLELEQACDRWLARRGIKPVRLAEIIKSECRGENRKRAAIIRKIRLDSQVEEESME